MPTQPQQAQQKPELCKAVCSACLWLIGIRLMTNKDYIYHVISFTAPRTTNYYDILDGSEYLRFLLIMVALSIDFMAMSKIKFLYRAMTHRQHDQLHRSLFMHYAFKYALMRLLLPGGLSGLATFGAWYGAVGFLHASLGYLRCELESRLVSPTTTVATYVKVLLCALAAATYALWIFVMLALFVLGESAQELRARLDTVASESDLVLRLFVSLVSSLLGPDTDTRWGNLTGSLCMYDALLALVDALQLAVHGGCQLMEMAVAKWSEAQEARAAQQGALSPASHGSNTGHWQAPFVATTSTTGTESSRFTQFKGSFLFHLDLMADLHRLGLRGMQHSLLWMILMDLRRGRFHWSFMLMGFDYMRILLAVRKRVVGYWRYCIVTHRLKHAFKDVRPAHPEPCSICMDTLVVGKQLPCGHQFHLGCLRAWMQQSGVQAIHLTCPNCRQPLMPKLSTDPPAEDGLAATAAAAAQDPAQEPVGAARAAALPASAPAHGGAPASLLARAWAQLALVLLLVPRLVLWVAMREYIFVLQMATSVMLWWVSWLARILRRNAPTLPPRVVMALQANWPSPEEREGWGESGEAPAARLQERPQTSAFVQFLIDWTPLGWLAHMLAWLVWNHSLDTVSRQVIQQAHRNSAGDDAEEQEDGGPLRGGEEPPGRRGGGVLEGEVKAEAAEEEQPGACPRGGASGACGEPVAGSAPGALQLYGGL